MRKHLRYVWCLIFLAPISLWAQDMVTAVGNDGLEKTVSYDVESFTDIRDKKLEDVLKKMPGISDMTFDGNTSFSYNGLFIEKIYVNGMDILQTGDPVYNMKPEDVERVEITENHIVMKVMKGMQYSNSASINVILKEGGESQWSGSVKGGLGFKPLLVNTDLNAINLGSKMQTTLQFKADNTGLNFAGVLNGFGGIEEDWMMSNSIYGGSGIDFSLKNFLNVQPTLAPLSPERVRFNRSAIANLGTSWKLNNDYQLSLNLYYHTDRLTASSFDETTYFLNGNETMEHIMGEQAKSHQHDIQADVILLSNTDKQFLRNQLSFATEWYDVDKTITGTFNNDQLAESKPLFLKDDFVFKHHLGKSILTLNANAGLYLRPQELHVKQKEETFKQNIKSSSAYAEVGAMIDRKTGKYLTLSLEGGATVNFRALDMQLAGFNPLEIPNIDSQTNIFNAYTGLSFTFITDKMQAELKFPLKYGHYNLKNKPSALDISKSKVYFSPAFSVKYEASKNLSLSLEAALKSNERKRMNLYPGMLFSDYYTINAGYPGFRGYRNTTLELAGRYSHPKSSVFVNVDLSYWGSDTYLSEIMSIDNGYFINGYGEGKYHSDWWEANANISKGIESLKGKIGFSIRSNLSKDVMERNGTEIPFTSSTISVSPYINGRLNSWWNVVYKLEYNTTHIKMDEFDTSTNSQSYTQTLEMIFSPWKKLNFSVLGEHYYTEFTDDVSKHLVLFDCKAEYNINDAWQLILSAKNILNQKTYNYTLADSEMFTKSYSSYEIRPRNILLSLYYKF